MEAYRAIWLGSIRVLATWSSRSIHETGHMPFLDRDPGVSAAERSGRGPRRGELFLTKHQHASWKVREREARDRNGARHRQDNLRFRASSWASRSIASKSSLLTST